MLKRAAAMGAGVIAIAVIAAAAVMTPHQANEGGEKPANITLVYVGAENCPPCRQWQGRARTDFLASAEFFRLAYREVKSPDLLNLLSDDHWPEDLRFLRAKIGKGAGVPLWLVIADDKIVMQGFGVAQWNETVLPRVKSLLR